MTLSSLMNKCPSCGQPHLNVMYNCDYKKWQEYLEAQKERRERGLDA